VDANDHVRVAREFFAAMEALDLERLIAVMHPEVVWELPGGSPVAGRFVGLEAVGGMVLRIAAMAEAPVQTKLVEMFANDDGVVA
jgi:ketosteroid isomerase-like protein